MHRYLRNITIPSAFITKSDGQALKDLFKRTGSADVEDVYIVMDWNDVLPRAEKVGPPAALPPDMPKCKLLRVPCGPLSGVKKAECWRLNTSSSQVEWEFWTNSNDMCGAVCDVQREFIKVNFTA